jgi:hypothetical protein
MFLTSCNIVRMVFRKYCIIAFTVGPTGKVACTNTVLKYVMVLFILLSGRDLDSLHFY